LGIWYLIAVYGWHVSSDGARTEGRKGGSEGAPEQIVPNYFSPFSLKKLIIMLIKSANQPTGNKCLTDDMVHACTAQIINLIISMASDSSFSNYQPNHQHG